MDKDISVRWAKLITENEEVQDQITKKIDSLRSGDSDDKMTSPKSPEFIQFIKDVDAVVSHLVMLVYEVDPEAKHSATNNVPERSPEIDKLATSLTGKDEMVEKRLRKKKKRGSAKSKGCSFADFTPQEIEARCNAMNLMDFPSFVRLLNTINKANAGKLE